MNLPKRVWLSLHPLARVILVLVFTIVFLHFTIHGERILNHSVSVFYLDEEFSLGTLFTSSLAIMAGLYFAYIAYYLRKNISEKLMFGAVSLFFFLLFLDEYLGIHEYVKEVLTSSTEGVFATLAAASWVFPLFGIVVLVLLMLGRLISIEKDKVVRWSYMVGFVCFVGVIVLELLGGQLYGQDIYLVFVGVEEGLEMLGITMFLNGALLTIDKSKNNLHREG